MSSYQLFRRIVTAYRPYWLIFIGGVVCTFLMSGVDSVFPYGLKLLIDKDITHPTRVVVHWVPLGILMLAFLRSGASVGSRYFMTRVAQSVVKDFRSAIFAKCLRLPASFYDKQSTGHILSKLLYNTDQVVQAGVDVLVNMLQDGSATIGLIVVMLVTSWRLFLIVVLFGPPIVLVAVWASRRMRHYSKRVQHSMGNITHIAEEGIKSYQAVRVYGGQSYEREKFDKILTKNLSVTLKSVLVGSLSSGSMQIFISIPLVLIFYLFHSVLSGLSAGSFIAFITAMVMIIKPLRRITNLNSQIQRGLAGAEGVFELLDVPDESDEGQYETTKVAGLVEIKQMSFRYPEADRIVLRDINLMVKPGQTVALVGRSGSGKTTLAKLISRFYEPTAGSIQLDGVDIGDYTMANFRSHLATVSQHVTLFNDTIAHNVAYGSQSGATHEDVMHALKLAHADEFVLALPDGVDTVVGENGIMLSGGQRQRIAIARAILKRAPILILDEATSALDTETERFIQAALENLMRTCTSIVIAHRLSTIESADLIVVMHEGCVVEQGTHQSLIAQSGYYAQLHQLQYEAQKDGRTDAEFL